MKILELQQALSFIRANKDTLRIRDSYLKKDKHYSEVLCNISPMNSDDGSIISLFKEEYALITFGNYSYLVNIKAITVNDQVIQNTIEVLAAYLNVSRYAMQEVEDDAHERAMKSAIEAQQELTKIINEVEEENR